MFKPIILHQRPLRTIYDIQLLRNILAPTKTPGDLVLFGEYVFFIWWTNAGPYRYWTTLTSIVGRGERYIRTKIGCNWERNIWGCSKQACNNGTLWQGWTATQGVVTCTYYVGLQNQCSHTSFLNPSVCAHGSREQEWKCGIARAVTRIGRKCVQNCVGIGSFIWNH